MHDLGEIIGRYVLTGVITGGALIVMMVIRLLIASTSQKNNIDVMEFLDIFHELHDADNSSKKRKAKSKVRKVLEWTLCFIVWPFFLVRMVHIYMKTETKAIAKAREQ